MKTPSPLILFLLLGNVLASAQYTLRTNAFSPLSRLSSFEITVEKGFKDSTAFAITLLSVFEPQVLNKKFYENIQKYTLVSKFNPYVELSYFFNKGISLSAGYGYIAIDRKETYCKDPQDIEGTHTSLCNDFITKQHEEKTQYFKLAPAIKIIETGLKFCMNFTFKPTFVYVTNNYDIWKGEDILSPGYERKTDVKFIYDYNFFFKTQSFYLIPKFELNVGYKF